MLVGTSVCLRHQQAILPQRCGLNFPLPDRCLVFNKAIACFGGRAAPIRYCRNGERERQALANHVNSVAASDPTAWRCALAINAHMPAGYRSRRTATGLEKSAVIQPSIYAQEVIGPGHAGSAATFTGVWRSKRSPGDRLRRAPGAGRDLAPAAPRDLSGCDPDPQTAASGSAQTP